MKQTFFLVFGALISFQNGLAADPIYQCKATCAYFDYGNLTQVEIITRREGWGEYPAEAQCLRLCDPARTTGCRIRGNVICSKAVPKGETTPSTAVKCEGWCYFKIRAPYFSTLGSGSEPIKGFGSTRYYASVNAQQNCVNHCGGERIDCEVAHLTCN